MNFDNDNPNITFESKVRKLERTFSDISLPFYNVFLIISKYMVRWFNPANKNIYVAFEHMYCHDHFTILFFSLKIGRKGIPIWFKTFKGKSDPEAFSEKTIKEGIDFVHDIFKHKLQEHTLIFLADRWFPNIETFQYIQSKGDKFVIRAKSDTLVDLKNYPNEENIHKICDIEPSSKAKYFSNVPITADKFKINLVVGPYDYKYIEQDGETIREVTEPLIVFTNDEPKVALKHYGYRFGAIEFIFKDQKSNGFKIESSKNRSLISFNNTFSLMCIAMVIIIIMGLKYSKNQTSIPKEFKIRTSKSVNRRRISVFKLGLTYLNIVFHNKYKFHNLDCKFILYDF